MTGQPEPPAEDYDGGDTIRPLEDYTTWKRYTIVPDDGVPLVDLSPIAAALGLDPGASVGECVAAVQGLRVERDWEAALARGYKDVAEKFRAERDRLRAAAEHDWRCPDCGVWAECAECGVQTPRRCVKETPR